MVNKLDYLLGGLFRKEVIKINEMRELMNYNSKILKEKGYTKEKIEQMLKSDIKNKDNKTFKDLYETGNELRELLLSDMTEDGIRELINKSIKEYREEELKNG